MASRWAAFLQCPGRAFRKACEAWVLGSGVLVGESMFSKKVCPVLTPAPANGRLSVIGVLADAVRLGRGHWGGP